MATRIINRITEAIRERARSFLKIQPAQNVMVNIIEMLDWTGNAIKNEIWYRGEAWELQQLYSQIDAPNTMFWKASSTANMEIRKIHTGIPGIIVDILTWIVISDMNDIVVPENREFDWGEIDKENDFKKLLSEAVSDTLIVGDGAFKVSVDSALSQYPIIEWYRGDKVEYRRQRGRIREVVFRSSYEAGSRKYILEEIYGYGYVTYRLLDSGREVPLGTLEETKDLQPVHFDSSVILAYPLMFFESGKYKGRGKSIYDSKIDAFDSLDEAWSQWMQALRQGRSREYIPENMLPRNPDTGEILPPNAFDFAYIETDGKMSETNPDGIVLHQPSIPHESYLATYITALDQALEGLVSPSTLGIDVKKLDNADAQREKEKVTLYTRNKIVSSLQKTLPPLLLGVFAALDLMRNSFSRIEGEVDVTFGEYANWCYVKKKYKLK